MKYSIVIFPLIFLVLSFCSNPAVCNDLESVRSNAIKLKSSSDLDVLIDNASDKKLVLLGEASHGTHEYYVWRDSISRRLIAEKGFNFIAVEGDFAMLFELNRYVKNLPGAASSAKEVLRKFDRWPTWMWANDEIVGLAEWLREYNDNQAAESKVGFYGIDVYDEWRSKTMLLNHLQDKAPDIHAEVRRQYNCFRRFWGESWQYGAAAAAGSVNCSGNTKRALEIIQENRSSFSGDCVYDYFYAEQNAHVIKNAEKFYRKSAMQRNDDSWNARVLHFYHTTLRLLDFYGEESKGIVWAHNTHIGDARFTDMVRFNQLNIGQLSRHGLGNENVMLVGFSTYQGNVKAGRQWGIPGEIMPVVRAQHNSFEEIMNRLGKEAFYLVFNDELQQNPLLTGVLGNRAIGVVFNPANEPRQYVRTIVPKRYDVMIFFRETKALKSLK